MPGTTIDAGPGTSEQLAPRVAALVRVLEQQHARSDVADFVVRLLFCMFADAVGLLPGGLLAELCRSPAHELGALFESMRSGGTVRGRRVERFGAAVMGERASVLQLPADALALVVELHALDWQRVDPAIFGTLLEQALDERERWSLGAHFTPRELVERLVLATLEPLEWEWRARQALFRMRSKGARPHRSRLMRLARSIFVPFHARLVALRVLDPACGTGNFLIAAYQRVAAIDLEYRTLIGELFGDQLIIEEALAVMPDRFVGIEKSARAAEISQLVLFIGHVQVWLARTGADVIGEHEQGRRDKIIAALAACSRSITVGDALIDDAGKPARWPAAEFIVGNPPYIGGRQLRRALGSSDVERLRSAYPTVPRSADLVMFWWHRAAELVVGGTCRRMGLITTSSIRQVQNRAVVRAALDGQPPLRIAWAVPDYPWTERGAQVRIAMMVVECVRADQPPAWLGRAVLDEHGRAGLAFESVERIHADLQAAHDLESAQPLAANAGLCFQGMNLLGKDGFVLERADVLALGYDPEALPAVLRPYLGGREFLHGRPEQYAIDAFGLDERELEQAHPRLHTHLLEHVRPLRVDNPRKVYRERWWLFGEPRPRLRRALAGLSRFIVTNETARHRTFEFVDVDTVPDHQLYAIASDDPFVLGVLLSLAHRCWSLARGGRQGVGNDPRYNGIACFSTFPFPDPPRGLRRVIADFASAFDELRKRMRHDDPRWTLARIQARLQAAPADDEDARLGVLRDLARLLDQRVGEAYGVEPDEHALLGALVRLNHERWFEEGAGRVRWLRPDLAEPGRERVARLEHDSPTRPPTPVSGWPRDPLARLQVLASRLVHASQPIGVDELCARMPGARPKTVARLHALLVGWRA